MDFNTLKRRAIPEPKLGRLSVVTSNKTKLSRHRARVALVRHLQKEIPHQLDVFGHGFKLVDDKADAIDGYRYHLVIENNTIPDFWTEKLADSYLGYSLPLYSGCPNVTKYFPDDSLILLGDITDHGGVTRQIRRILEDDPWSRRLSSILEARHLLLNRHNLFSILARVISSDTTQQSKLSVTETILPFERQFRGPIGKLRHLVNRAQVLAARR